MARYLDPKADLTFKKVFGEHKDLVISFLNALLPLEPGRQVESIEYLAPELVPRTPESKYSIVDVRCGETGGRKFIVEMQVSWLRFLTEIGEDTRQVPQDLLDEPHVNKALGILEESAYSKAEMYAYDKFWDQASVEATYRRDMAGAIASRDAAVASRDAERTRADAAETRADAAVEKLRMTVRQMKAGGMDVEMIAKFTGLTIADVDGV